MQSSSQITPVILTRDESPNIGRTLEHLRWADDVVVVDSLSTDDTAAIARSFPNVRLFERPFDDHASQWNFAVSQAKTDWVLTLDADYIVTEALVREIDALESRADIAGYEARFVYAVHGHPLRASLYPPRTVLLRRWCFEFYLDGHTQRTRITRGEVRQLREPIVHDDRKSFAAFLERQKRYARSEARKLRSADRQTLNAAARIRKLRVIAPLLVVPYLLFGKGLILDGRAGARYVAERFIAEWMLAIALFRN